MVCRSEAPSVLPLQHGAGRQRAGCGLLGPHVARVAILPAGHRAAAGEVARQPAGSPVRGPPIEGAVRSTSEYILFQIDFPMN